MAHHGTPADAPPEPGSAFDPRSGSWLERALFNHRGAILALCALVTLLLGAQIGRVELNASFDKAIPTGHPYIVNYQANAGDLKGFGNVLRVVVEATGPSIYDPAYMATLQRISSALFLLPGVDRAGVKSLWTPNTRWVGVTEDGLEGGPVVPLDFSGSPQSLAALRANIERSGEVGQLVATDHRSSIVFVPLLATMDDSGRPLDYGRLSHQLEELRDRFEAEGVRIHIVGFAKVTGDLIDGVRAVALFFLGAIAITTAILYLYTHCIRSTLLVVSCSLVAVLWQVGLLPLIGRGLDPYSVLVPFLVFAIGMSHGAQKMNGIMQDIGRGVDKIVAARLTFRRLFLAGLTALLCDVVGFAVLLIIDIPAIRELAVAASIGVAMLIFTNLILLPVLLSHVGVGERAARRSLREEEALRDGAAKARLWALLDHFTTRRWATAAVVLSTLLGGFGFMVSRDLRVGDLDPGAPELRAGSRYNRDSAYLVAHYMASSDVFAVMVRTPPGACAAYDTLMRVDALEWRLRQVGGVNSTKSLALLNRELLTGLNEGSPKWYELQKNQSMLNLTTGDAPQALLNADCSLLVVSAFLDDHKADTLRRVAAEAEAFAAANGSPANGNPADGSAPGVRFLLAAGSGGIDAATNMVVGQASQDMLYWVYGAVILLSFVTFRSWRGVVVAVLPLILTSILSEALMVWLGIGVKVATLPVIALGVGIGVDYALYVLSIVLVELRRGASLSVAYHRALMFTGKVVLLTGLTLALGVATWAFSPIKFQADMGILLAFMFLWNMLGALVLLPALACLLFPAARTVPLGVAATAPPVGSPCAPTPLAYRRT